MPVTKRLSLLMLALFLLAGCNLPRAATPDPMEGILTIVASQVSALSTGTALAVEATQTAAKTPMPTFTLPTPTLTLIFAASPTPTPNLLDCPLKITLNDTSSGDMLHVLRCEDSLEYDLGPFAKGVYAAAPNLKFIIYVTNSGSVFAAKVGEPRLLLVMDLAKERYFTAINLKVLPKFIVTFAEEAPYYRLVLYEAKYKQKNFYRLPAQMQE